MDINKLISKEISKQYQTNTFTGGMNTDISSTVLPAELYRYAENIRIVTDNDASTGEVKLIDGTTEIPITGIYEEGYTYTILTLDSIRDLGVLILKRDTDSDANNMYNGWAVFTFKKGENSYTATQNTDWFHDNDEERIWPEDWDGESKPITTVLRWESEKNIKLYIADGIHNIMVVLLHDDNRNKSFDKLFSYSRQSLPKLNVSVLNNFSGTLKAGVVQYAYRLYKKYGQASLLSPLSVPLSLYKNETTGYGPEKNSSCAVRISLPPTNQFDLNYIQIYRINFVLSGQLPEIHLIKDQTTSAAESTIDYGTNIQQIDFLDFLSLYSLDIKPAIIESKGNYMYGANLGYGIEDVEEKFKDFDARCFSSGNYSTDIDYTFFDANEAYQNGTIVRYDDGLLYKIWANHPAGQSWSDTSKIKYDVFEEDTIPIEKLNHLQFDNRLAIDLVKWDKKYWLWTENNSTNIGGIGKCLKWEYEYNLYSLSDSDQTGSISNSYRTYRRGEVYRFGIKLYDKYGHSSTVKWIADIMIPNDDEYGPYWIDGNAVQIGIKFTPININSSYWNDVYAYEIVQSPRTITDKRCITQGIVSFPITDYNSEYPTIYPSGLFTTNSINYNLNKYVNTGTDRIVNGAQAIEQVDHLYYASRTVYDVIMFTSPEYVNQPDDIKSSIDLGGVYERAIIQYSPSNMNTMSMDKCFESNTDDVLSINIAGTNPGGYFYKVNRGTKKDSYEINSDVVSFNRSYPGDNGNTDNLYIDENNTGVPRRSYANNMVSTKYGNLWKYNYLNYVTPNISTAHRIVDSHINLYLTDFSYIDSPRWDEFIKGDLFTYTNNQINVGLYTFINWSVAPIDYDIKQRNTSAISSIRSATDNRTDGYDDDPRVYKYGLAAIVAEIYSPISSGGKIMLFRNLEGNDFTFSTLDNTHYEGPQITVINLCRNAIPYGGYNNAAIQNSEYLSLGNYIKIRENDGSLMSDTNMSVYSGDAFFKYFTYVAGHDNHNNLYVKFCNVATVYNVPLEMDIDIQGQFSNSVFKSTSNNYKIQDEPSQYDTYVQDEGVYMYNTAYNIMPNLTTWSVQDVNNLALVNYDTRVHVSQEKANNENIDNFMLFKALDFIDVDSRYGEITGLHTYDNALIFWLKTAAGIISSNERTILKDENSAQIQLGSGAILERYDYISTIYGMKPNQHAYASSNTDLYWWDGYNKEILSTRGKQVIPLTTLKQVRSYVNKYNESDIPTLYYDNKYKEVVCNVVNNEALVYNEQVAAFTSIYKFKPEWYSLFGTDQIVTKQTPDDVRKLYLYNTSINDESKLFGINATPLLKYVVNALNIYNKVFDLQNFGGCFYAGDGLYRSNLNFKYNTPLKQQSQGNGNDLITDVEYDFRLAIPRNNNDFYGGRMRGKFMECEISSGSNNLDFSLHYIITKFRISWT